jgi:hypothetical protein
MLTKIYHTFLSRVAIWKVSQSTYLEITLHFKQAHTTHLHRFLEKGMLVVEDKTLGWVGGCMMRAFPK